MTVHDELCIEYVCKDGVTRRLDIGEPVRALGFHYQQQVTTPLGPGKVLGVFGYHLYFKLDADHAASCWCDCLTEQDFIIKGILGVGDSIPAPSSMSSGHGSSDYHNLKQVHMNGQAHWIVLQSVNGPCPVIALANALILSNRLTNIVQEGSNAIEAAMLRRHLLTFLRQQHDPPRVDGAAPTEHNGKPTLAGLIRGDLEGLREHLLSSSSAEELLLKFYSGLFVSPIFSHIDGFDGEDPNTALFALAGVRLVHGWIFGEHNRFSRLRFCSYNESQDKAFDDDCDPDESSLAKELIQPGHMQLTSEGLHQLTSTLAEGEVCVQFYNNHFSTIVRRDGNVLRLISDSSFMDQTCVVFERLVDTHGAVDYLDGNGEAVDAIMLSVQASAGNRFTEDQIRLVQAELFSETMSFASAESVIRRLEQQAREQQVVSVQPTAAPLAIMPRPPDAQTSPAASPDDGANQLIAMGLCTNIVHAREVLRRHGSVALAVDALLP